MREKGKSNEYLEDLEERNKGGIKTRENRNRNENKQEGYENDTNLDDKEAKTRWDIKTRCRKMRWERHLNIPEKK